MPKSKITLITGIFAFGAIILLVAYFVLFAPVSFQDKTTRFDVTSGKSLSRIAADLKDQGLVRSTAGIRIAWMITGVDTIKAAGYSLSPNMDAWEVARTLGSDKVTNFNVTIPEGYTVLQVADSLKAKGVITDTQQFVDMTKSYLHPTGLLAGVPAENGLEGYLFPDTYNFYPESQASTIIDAMTKTFVARMTKLNSKIDATGMPLHKIITLASLVEKEAKTDEDRKMIAGVLENRLKQNMRLDVDATVRYIFNNWTGPITQAQLDSDSPYNTRKVVGLPPGPICNPGLAAIEAVLSPTPNDYLYYLTGKDGKTYYAKTLAEHNQNKAKYL